MGMCMRKGKRKKNQEAIDRVAMLPQKRVESYREAFALVDRNNDGYISAEELGQLMSTNKKNLTNQQLQDIIAQYDINGDKMIDFEEFVLMMEKNRAGDTRCCDDVTDKELHETFKLIDDNGDGFVTTAELKKMMWQLGEEVTDEEVKDMMIRAKPKTEGKLTFEEFLALMRQKRV